MSSKVRAGAIAALAFTLTGCLTGCMAFTSPGRVRLKDVTASQVLVADYDATRRQVICVRHGERLLCCAEPSPDVAFELAAKAVGAVTYAGVTGSVSPELVTRFLELSGRSETIMFLRESRFGLCEHAMAGTLTPSEVRDLYKIVLDAARDFAAEVRAQEEGRVIKLLKEMSPEEQRIYDGVIRGR